MKKDFFLARYALIIKRLERSPATFEEIEQFLLDSREFQDANVYQYSIRTLQRDLKDINSLFNLVIQNKKKGDNRYFIASRPVMEVDEYNQRLLESYQIINAINAYPDFAEYVFLEPRKPRGIDSFYDLLFAIRNKKVVEFEYFSFLNQKITKRKVHPLALKESKDRWYLIAVDTKDKKTKSFGLDRIKYLDVYKASYRERYKIDVKEHFKNSFGVMNLEKQKPQKIVLECTKQQAEYVKSFPLHSTQELVSETPEKVVFELCLHPTYDFMQEILSYGKEVKVLEPQCLIDDIKIHLQESMKNYFL